jgi:hypothetical protein
MEKERRDNINGTSNPRLQGSAGISSYLPYLTNDGCIEVAQRMAGHSNAKTTGVYNRRNDDISMGEVERITAAH